MTHLQPSMPRLWCMDDGCENAAIYIAPLAARDIGSQTAGLMP